MTQAHLSFAKPTTVRHAATQSRYDDPNRLAAEIILADPDKYKGGLMWIWAELWMAAHGGSR